MPSTYSTLEGRAAGNIRGAEQGGDVPVDPFLRYEDGCTEVIGLMRKPRQYGPRVLPNSLDPRARLASGRWSPNASDPASEGRPMYRRIRSFSLAASLAVSSVLGGGAAVLVPSVVFAASCNPSASLAHSGYSITFTGSSTCTGTGLQSTTVFVYAQRCDIEGPFGICIQWNPKYRFPQQTCNYVTRNIIVCTKTAV